MGDRGKAGYIPLSLGLTGEMLDTYLRPYGGQGKGWIHPSSRDKIAYITQVCMWQE